MSTAQEQPPALEARRVVTHIPTERGLVRAVDGVSFEVAPGRTLAIVGESGSGKSMLLRSLLSLPPRGAQCSGEVLLQGQELTSLSRAQLRRSLGTDIAIVLQDPTGALNPVLRIEKLLTEGLPERLSRRKKRERALDMLNEVGIADPARRLRQYPGELSGGMKQRVAIAAALAGDPKVLLADEITSALDATVGARIDALIQYEQQKRQLAVVNVSHDIAAVAGTADDLAVMYAGRIVDIGPAAAVLSAPAHPYTAALIECVPRASRSRTGPRNTIPGRPVDLTLPPTGCRFAPRCAFAEPDCDDGQPTLEEHGPEGHRVACFHPLTEQVVINDRRRSIGGSAG